MRIIWWLYPGMHETARMRVDGHYVGVLFDDPSQEPALTGYELELAGAVTGDTSGRRPQSSAFVVL
jgi:hypothetical protein